PDPARLGMPVLNPGVVGTIEDIPGLVERLHVDRVVVSLSDARGRLPMDTLLTVRLDSGVTFDHLASVYEEYTGKIAVENLRPSWFIFSSGFRKTRLLGAEKRMLDLIASTVGLVLAAPIMAVVAVLVKLGSPGPILYHQRRVGLQGRQFTVHKFRTMRQDAEAATGPVWSRQNDNRINRVGRFLRRSRLDELPQLWNVLRGEMSLVGPWPERPEFVDQLTREIRFQRQGPVAKPGLTGEAPVVGRARKPGRREHATPARAVRPVRCPRDVLRAGLDRRTRTRAGATDRRGRARNRVSQLPSSAPVHTDAEAVPRGHPRGE